MEYWIMLKLQRLLFYNVSISILWIIVNIIFLYFKFSHLGDLTKYLSVTVFLLLAVIEFPRLYLGYYGNLSCRVPELAGFLMLSILMQMPLISFFLFNPYLLNTPTEITIHATLWVVAFAEIIFSFLALKQASSVAKSIYLFHSKNGITR